MTKKQRTWLDELGQLWPLLDALHFRILVEVGDNPGQSMTEISERLDLELTTVFFNVETLGSGHRNRHAYGLVRTEKSDQNKRRQLVYLTLKGFEVTKLLQPLNVPIEDVKTEKPLPGQQDFFKIKQKVN